MVGLSTPSTAQASGDSATDLAARSKIAPPADSRLRS